MHIYDLTADTLLHCYIVDERENGKAIRQTEKLGKVIAEKENENKYSELREESYR